MRQRSSVHVGDGVNNERIETRNGCSFEGPFPAARHHHLTGSYVNGLFYKKGWGVVPFPAVVAWRRLEHYGNPTTDLHDLTYTSQRMHQLASRCERVQSIHVTFITAVHSQSPRRRCFARLIVMYAPRPQAVGYLIFARFSRPSMLSYQTSLGGYCTLELTQRSLSECGSGKLDY